MQHHYISIQKAFVSCTSEMILQQGTFISDSPVQTQNLQTTSTQTRVGMHTNISVHGLETYLELGEFRESKVGIISIRNNVR